MYGASVIPVGDSNWGQPQWVKNGLYGFEYPIDVFLILWVLCQLRAFQLFLLLLNRQKNFLQIMISKSRCIFPIWCESRDSVGPQNDRLRDAKLFMISTNLSTLRVTHQQEGPTRGPMKCEAHAYLSNCCSIRGKDRTTNIRRLDRWRFCYGSFTKYEVVQHVVVQDCLSVTEFSVNC